MMEQKLHLADQGVASQTADKAFDAMQEAALNEPNLELVKRKYKEHVPEADYRRRGGHEPEGTKAFSNKV